MDLLTNEKIERLQVGTIIFFTGNAVYAPMFGEIEAVRNEGASTLKFDMKWEVKNSIMFNGSSTENIDSLSSDKMVFVENEKHKLTLQLMHSDKFST